MFCQKALHFLVDIQKQAKVSQNFITDPVRQEFNPVDLRTAGVTIRKLNLHKNLLVATVDAFFLYVNK